MTFHDLGVSGQNKTIKRARDHIYFINAKIDQNPSRGSWKEVEKVNCLTNHGQHLIIKGN